MRIAWSLPVRGERLDSPRGDLVRARFLVEALRSQGHELTVVEDAATARAQFTVSTYRNVVRRFMPEKLAWLLRDTGRWLHARRHGRRVAAAARAERAELIVETQVAFAGSGALAQRLTGLPLIIDDCSPSSEERALGTSLPGLARRILRQQAEAAVAVIAVSAGVRERLVAEGVSHAKLHVVPNGVDLDAYSESDREPARTRLGLTGKVAIGYVGSFLPWHRVPLLVAAFARLKDAPETALLLVGDGPDRQATVSTVQTHGLEHRVRFQGAVAAAEIPELLAALDVAVLPGTYEYGHPMKLVEYAAAARAIVAPDINSVRALFADERSGLLFPPDDDEALTAALGKLVADAGLRERLGLSARAQIGSDASWSSRAKALLASASTASKPAGSSHETGVQG